MSRSAVKGRGVDCIGFVSAVIDELYRKKFVSEMPSPIGQSHASETFAAFYKERLRLWPMQKSDTVDCGDLVLDRPKHGHAHVYITGVRPYTLWHALHGDDVHETGFGSLGENLTLFKLTEKYKWI